MMPRKNNFQLAGVISSDLRNMSNATPPRSDQRAENGLLRFPTLGQRHQGNNAGNY
jgi:hypothetical protein